MSAPEQPADSACSGQNKVVPSATSENPDNGCGDVPNVADVGNLNQDLNSSSVDTGGIVKPLSPKLSRLDECNKEIPSVSGEVSVDESRSVVSPKSTSLVETCDNSEIQKSKDFLSDILSKDDLTIEDVAPIATVSDSEDDADQINLEAKAKPMYSPGYKETVIDDVSESEMQLRWTDDEDDDQMQANFQPLSDEALKKLDQDLGIIEADNKTEESGSKFEEIINQNVTTEEKSIGFSKTKVLEKPFENVEGDSSVAVKFQDIYVTDNIIDADLKHDDAFKSLDQEHCITGDEKTVDESIKKTVEELQQLIDDKSDVVEQKLELIDEEIKSVVRDDSKTNISVKEEHIEAMDVDLELDNKTPVPTSIETPKSIENKLEEAIVNLENVDNIQPDSIPESKNELKEKMYESTKDCIDFKMEVNNDLENVSNILNIDSDITTTEKAKISKEVETNTEEVDTTKMVDTSAKYINADTETVDIKKDDDMNAFKIANDVDTDTKQLNLIKDVNISTKDVDITKEIDTNTEKVGITKECDTDTGNVDITKEVGTSPKDVDVTKEVHTSTKDVDLRKEADTNIENVDLTQKLDTITKDVVITKEVDTSTKDVEITKEVDKNTEIVHITMDVNINTAKVDVTKEVDTNEEEFGEMLTPDVTNDSIKINTAHRIKRPDVMLDIPTQEFDFDEDFDETSELIENQTKSEKMDVDSCNMIEKTVSEIVNQLEKDQKEDALKSKETTKMVTNVVEAASIIEKETTDKNDSYSSLEKDKESEKITVQNITVTTEKEASEEIHKKQTNKPDETDDKIISPSNQNAKEITTDEGKKSVAVIKSDDKPQAEDPKPSTSTAENTKTTSEDSKLTPDNEDAQEVSDSLGLLAESSRVLDDEDEDQELEEEDGDDVEGDDDEDDDFDPADEESSNQLSATEHSDESNPAHSETAYNDTAIDIVYESNVIGLVSDSNDANDEFTTEMLAESTEITVEENEPVALLETTDIVAEEKEDQKDDAKSKDETTDSTKEAPKPTERRKSILSQLLASHDDDIEELQSSVTTKKSPDKLKNLQISEPKNEVSIVDLEETSSEDDVQESKECKEAAPTTDPAKGSAPKGQLSKSDGQTGDGGKEKPAADVKEKPKIGEVFNLDSDEEDKIEAKKPGEDTRNNQCINHNCISDDSVAYYLADRVTVAYYGAARRRRRAVCQNCRDVVTSRNQGLVSGIKALRPLLSLRMARPAHQPLEISDSDSEGEGEPVGEGGAKILEERLTDLMNEAWSKYKMDDRIKETEDYLEAELVKMQKQSEEIDQLLKTCQTATDSLRVNFYSTFEPSRKDLPALSIHDTPIASYACLETEEDLSEATQPSARYPKRRSTGPITETPAKKPAIPLGYPDDKEPMTTRSSAIAADLAKQEDKDISVVRLTGEMAPASLPPPGAVVRAPLRAGAQVYAMKNQYGAWLRGTVSDILPKASDNPYTQCRIRFDHKAKNPSKVLSARSIAYTEPCSVRMTIGTRVIALFKSSDTANKRESFFYSGVIAEIPNPVNNYRYLVFFDDGYVQYVQHHNTRLVYESSALVWEEVHPFSRDFVCNYLMKYPERPMVRMHQGQSLTVEWNGKWWETKVLKVDAALVMVKFQEDNRTEWIYRGSTRLQPLFAELQAARRGDRARLPRSTKANTKTNMPYVEYTRSDEQANKPADIPQAQIQSVEELRRQRAVAKKSTSYVPPPTAAAADGVVSRVVFYTPKNSVRPYKMVPHSCGVQCRRGDLLSLRELRTYNPLTKPLLSGWERQIVRHKHHREVLYRAPCGRRLRNMPELHRYLRALRSELSVDLFDFNPNTHCLAEFVLNKSNVQKKDLSHGKENVPVPCVNYYDHSLPEFCSYNTERTPTAGVPLNLDPDFLCGCDCEDDCADKSKCSCWKMTLEGARTIGMEGNVGYEYRRLPEPLPSGIYECNSRCKCKSTCLNRVVQNPLQLKLQVFKTLNRGWGIRALNDVPKGAFLCIYAGNLLTDATANLDGLNEGDEYLAELDYIEVVESMKEGYEEDIPEADKNLDKKDSKKSSSEPETETESEEEEERRDKTDIEDDDFRPGHIGLGLVKFNKRLRRRDKNKKKEGDEQKKEEKEQPAQEKKEEGEDCITISDDEEVRVSQREPARFAAQEGMSASKLVPKYRSIRTYFGKDEACYIMDAKVQGNIGRYLNHSCSPNVFVQNVFVDTHDPRFPWVSFFALHPIRAGTELTWNYNYDVGSVPGKVLYCHCGAPNCRGRLL